MFSVVFSHYGNVGCLQTKLTLWFGLPSLSCQEPTLVTLLPWVKSPKLAGETVTLFARWTRALSPIFSAVDLAETWCRTSARCFRPPPAGGARAAFLTGHEGVFHPHVRFWSAVGFHYSLSRFPSFDHSRRLFTSLTSLLSVAPSRFPRVCISFSLSAPFRLCSSGVCSPFSVRVLLCSLFGPLPWFFFRVFTDSTVPIRREQTEARE